MKVTHNTCLKTISSQCVFISGVEIWGGGGESIKFEIWRGHGPLSPPGSSAYGMNMLVYDVNTRI